MPKKKTNFCTEKAAHEICNETLETLAGEKPAYSEKILDLKRDLTIFINDRMRTAAGRACYSDSTIELNPHLLNDNAAEFRDTVLHELAHLLDKIFFRRASGHGRKWRYVAALIGAKPERCHALDTKKLRRPQKIRAHALCGCEGVTHALKTGAFNKFMKGSTYTCRRCKEPIRLEREICEGLTICIGGPGAKKR